MPKCSPPPSMYGGRLPPALLPIHNLHDRKLFCQFGFSIILSLTFSIDRSTWVTLPLDKGVPSHTCDARIAPWTGVRLNYVCFSISCIYFCAWLTIFWRVTISSLLVLLYLECLSCRMEAGRFSRMGGMDTASSICKCTCPFSFSCLWALSISVTWSSE